MSLVTSIDIHTRGQGLHEVTAALQQLVHDADVVDGLCTVLIRHTSASLLIQENADASARHDLENWLMRLVPEHDPLYTHTTEGADDMPAHIKAALTATSLSIPVMNRRLALGTWQGVYVWEHRRQGGRRQLAIHIGP
jgi:secondary thiamine-phosphate synthase enzyme